MPEDTVDEEAASDRYLQEDDPSPNTDTFPNKGTVEGGGLEVDGGHELTVDSERLAHSVLSTVDAPSASLSSAIFEELRVSLIRRARG